MITAGFAKGTGPWPHLADFRPASLRPGHPNGEKRSGTDVEIPAASPRRSYPRRMVSVACIAFIRMPGAPLERAILIAG